MYFKPYYLISISTICHIYKGGSRSSITYPISSHGSPAISRITVLIFPQSSFPRLLYIIASSSSTSESILGTLKQVWPSSLNAQLYKVLDPRKRLPSKGWFDFWKQPEIAPSQVSMVDVSSNGYHCHQGTSVRCELCGEMHCRDATGSRPTSSLCRWLNLQKNFGQN